MKNVDKTDIFPRYFVILHAINQSQITIAFSRPYEILYLTFNKQWPGVSPARKLCGRKVRAA